MGQTATATGWAWVRDISRYQWMIFLIAWLGWSLDNTDFNLFSLVLRPALTELLGGNPTAADIGRVGGILSMVGLLGWALDQIDPVECDATGGRRLQTHDAFEERRLAHAVAAHQAHARTGGDAKIHIPQRVATAVELV